MRNRLDKMKGSVSAQMNDLFAKMMNVNPEDVLTEEEITQHLTEAFNKFESSGDGRLGNKITFHLFAPSPPLRLHGKKQYPPPPKRVLLFYVDIKNTVFVV